MPLRMIIERRCIVRLATRLLFYYAALCAFVIISVGNGYVALSMFAHTKFFA